MVEDALEPFLYMLGYGYVIIEVSWCWAKCADLAVKAGFESFENLGAPDEGLNNRDLIRIRA